MLILSFYNCKYFANVILSIPLHVYFSFNWIVLKKP